MLLIFHTQYQATGYYRLNLIACQFSDWWIMGCGSPKLTIPNVLSLILSPSISHEINNAMQHDRKIKNCQYNSKIIIIIMKLHIESIKTKFSTALKPCNWSLTTIQKDGIYLLYHSDEWWRDTWPLSCVHLCRPERVGCHQPCWLALCMYI